MAEQAQTVSGNRRDHVIDAAEIAFLSKGRPNVSMEEVASLAGVSRGYIYKHFKCRDGLTLAILERRATMFNARALSFIRKQTSFEDALVEGLMLAVNLAYKDPHFGSLIGAALGGADKHVAGAPESALRFTDELWRPFLLEARAKGELADHVDLNDLVQWLTLLLLSLLAQKRALGASEETQRRQVRTLFVPAVVTHARSRATAASD